MNYKKLYILTLLTASLFLFNYSGVSQPVNNDSLTKLQLERIQQEITILQHRFNRLYNRLDQNTRKLIDQSDSGIDLLVSETLQIKQNQNEAFENQSQQISALKKELKTTHEQYRQNSMQLYVLLGLAMILLIAVLIMLYQIRRKSVEVLAQKSDKIFDQQSAIHQKTTDLLNLHTEISEAIEQQHKLIKKQKKNTGIATKKAVKDTIKKKYRKD